MKLFNKITKNLIGLGCIGLLIFVLVLSTRGLRSGNPTISNLDQRIMVTATTGPYPAPISTRTSLPNPTPTNPPKWTRTPTLIPTPTLSPTPLPLRSSQFTVIWSESNPNQQTATIWAADPTDLGKRKAWVTLKNQQIQEAALSPDGKKIAFSCLFFKTHTFFVYNIETDRLTQLDLGPNAGPILWDRESRFFSFLSVLRSNVIRTTDEDDYPQSVTVGVYDIAEQRQRKIIELPGDYQFTPLGWTANGRLLITHPEKGSYDYTVAEISPTTQEIQSFFKFSVPELVSPFRLSPDGSKFFYCDSQGFHWMTLNGQKMEVTSKFTGNHGMIWSTQNDLLVGQFENTKNSIYHLNAIGLQTKSEQEISQFALKDPYGWNLMSISPDDQWLAVSQYVKGVFYLIFLPDFHIVPIDVSGYYPFFIGWTDSIKNGK